MKMLCPSILSADFTKLETEIITAENAGAEMMHCDIMDGHFVPNITFGQLVVDAVNSVTKLPLDVHLMIENPERYIKEFRKAGADFISVHYENNHHHDRIINLIKETGAKAGIAINPGTPIDVLNNIASLTDFILIMSVNPGFGGQKFIPYTIDKIKKLRAVLDNVNPLCMIEVDGGVDINNISEISKAGADMFVAGASIFKSGDISNSIKEMKKLIQ